MLGVELADGVEGLVTDGGAHAAVHHAAALPAPATLVVLRPEIQ